MDTNEIPQTPSHRRFLSGAITGALVATLLVGGISVYAHSGGMRWGRHGGHGPCGVERGAADANMMSERAGFAAGWVLSRIDATAEQEQQVKAIISDAIGELAPLREKHCEAHQTLIEVLSQSDIDRDALGQLRQSTLDLADTASARIVTALADAAEVLTPQQRSELLQLAQRFHH